ncbi:hypothetical protein [Streptomyces sp. SID13726]|nr:hypothetical protein [Streptomyces sp. SID13726]NEA98834.1 hypothetical protein [Streptomyces sp. SID13726]
MRSGPVGPHGGDAVRHAKVGLQAPHTVARGDADGIAAQPVKRGGID